MSFGSTPPRESNLSHIDNRAFSSSPTETFHFSHKRRSTDFDDDTRTDDDVRQDDDDHADNEADYVNVNANDNLFRDLNVNAHEQFYRNLLDNDDIADEPIHVNIHDNLFINDDDNDNMMSMNTTANITPFYGLYSENAAVWLNNFDHWLATQRNLNERARISHFALQLRGPAKSWLGQLEIADGPPALEADQAPNPNRVHLYADLRTRFLNHFRRGDDVRSLDVAALYDYKQGLENSEQFVTEMLKRGESANASEEQVRFAVLHGLRENVKAVVLQHPTDNLGEILKWATTAERIQSASSSEITNAVEKLDKMMQKLQVSSMNYDSSNLGEEQEGYDSSVAPIRNVRRGMGRAPRPNYSFDDQYQPGNSYYQGGNQGPRFQGFSHRGRGQRSRGAAFRGWANPRASNQSFHNATYFPPQNFDQNVCQNCGYQHSYGQCRARGQICHGCGK